MFCTWALKVRRAWSSAHMIAFHCPSHPDKGRDSAILILKEHHLKPSMFTVKGPLSLKKEEKRSSIFLADCFRKPGADLLFFSFSKAFHGRYPLAVQLGDFYLLSILFCTWEYFWQCLCYFYDQKEKYCICFYFPTSSIHILSLFSETFLGLLNTVTTWTRSMPPKWQHS